MEIIVGKTAGFCFGVLNAVKKTEEQIKKNKNIYCLGELVHNNEVIEKLKKQGVKFVDSINQAKDTTIIRAHGATKEIYELAKKLNLKLIDLTCPKVLNIHKIAEEFSNNNYFIFLVGNKTHPEVIGTKSFCGKNSYIIEQLNEIDEAMNNLKQARTKKILIISQTTFSVKKFNEIVKQIEDKLGNKYEIQIKNTICNATQTRQEETKEISKKVDFMIIIGGKNSSNTNKLYEISKGNCKTILIENEKELINIKNNDNVKSIGIMAGASTPKESVIKTIEIIEKSW